MAWNVNRQPPLPGRNNTGGPVPIFEYRNLATAVSRHPSVTNAPQPPVWFMNAYLQIQRHVADRPR